MKKSTLLIMTLAIASVAVIMFACKKEGEPQANNGKPTELTIPQDNEALARLMQFRKQEQLYRENPAMKSGETLTIDEAMLNIADLFNATYTEPEEYYSETMQHEFSLTLDLRGDNTVLLTDVLSAYEQAVAIAREAYVASNFSNKGYVNLLVDDYEQEGNMLRIDFVGKFGEKHAAAQNTVIFEDDWRYSEMYCGGKCDDHGYGSGADKELQAALKDEMVIRHPIVANDCRTIYLEQRSLRFKGNNPVYPGIFYRTDVNETCISAEEMNELYEAECWCIFNVGPRIVDPTPPQQQNYMFYPFDITIDGIEETVNNGIGETTYITHKNVVVYGKYLAILHTDLPLQKLGN